MNAPILVTGAGGGEQGSTGRHVVELLRQQGLPVRAMVHRLDARCQQLANWGAEVVVGDFLDLHSIRAAMRGARCAYLAYPVQAGLLEASANFAIAARDAQLDAVVEVGHLNNREDSPSPRTREHWLSELWSEILGQRDGHELARIAEAVGGVEHLANPLRQLTGREPMTLAEDIRNHRTEFR